MEDSDHEDDYSLESIHERDIDEPYEEVDILYARPFSVDNITITGTSSFIRHEMELRELFMSIYEDEDMWMDLSAGMLNAVDDNERDGSANYLSMMLNQTTLCDFSDIVHTVDSIDNTCALEDSDLKDSLEKAIRELTLESAFTTKPPTKFEIKDYKPSSNSLNLKFEIKNYPPMCPIRRASVPILLVFRANKKELQRHLDLRTEWIDVIKQYDPSFPDTEIDMYGDANSIATSRSRNRPEKSRSVDIVYEDGSRVNVGIHGYHLKKDVALNLDLTNMDLAAQELFLAPGGEGLGCPSPSHILHQLVSAILSNSLNKYVPLVEEKMTDIKLCNVGRMDGGELNIDITSSVGLWNKALGPTKTQKDLRYQAAISKYDLAAVFLHQSTGRLSNLLYKSVANCLLCEHPGIYQKQETDVPDDLKIQESIYRSLSLLSDRTMSSLSEMCYDAAMLESIDQMKGLDINLEGKSWKDKTADVLSTLDGLKPRSNIAIPPYPLGEITDLPKGQISINILGNDFIAGDYETQGRSSGPKYHMDECDVFLKNFPASGIVTYSDSQDIARHIDNNPLCVHGKTHQGPAYNYQGIDECFATMANELYSASSQAQYAEIRADLCRCVMKSPMPKKDVWVQAFLYKGKVLVWYRCRDSPTSPDGYRIDWFAVSSFEVVGGKPIKSNQGDDLYLWPRQRLRSQELTLTHSGPRKLKATLFSLCEKAISMKVDPDDIWKAWNRLAVTLNSSTYASGKMFLTCRYLSTTISSPSSPFDKMCKKLVNPVNFADVMYIIRLRQVMSEWVTRDQYLSMCPIIGLPRYFSQLESYWMMWVPCDFADKHKNMTDCVISLYDEAKFLKDSMEIRTNDLNRQHALLMQGNISVSKLRDSLKKTCSLDTDGVMGWSWVGSLASAYALKKRSSPSSFDKAMSTGRESRGFIDHLTVRHSARVDESNFLHKGTVAEMMIDQGVDDYLSTVDQTYRYLFSRPPLFFNHPKSGEHKPREISITDPDSRICLTDAEYICGAYGRSTGIDFLKDPTKNSKFYKHASRVMSKGGCIQSSDATRYGPSMSNFAISIMLMSLGSESMHLKWASSVYARLAYRRMLIPLDILPYLSKMATHTDTIYKSLEVTEWIKSMPICCTDGKTDYAWYTTSHHMGQGMAHHSSSLLHAGALAISCDSAGLCEIHVGGKIIPVKFFIMVTSDDSTVLAEPYHNDPDVFISRAERQLVGQIALKLVRHNRDICLRMVSVKPNLIKEMISSVKGEFNSQDTGIGSTCPVLGFREMISNIVIPSAPSLIGDYLNGYAVAQNCLLSGQGLSTACFVHSLMIDSIEERWGIKEDEKILMNNTNVLPKELINGSHGTSLFSNPSSLINPKIRGALLAESFRVNSISQDLDPHTRDSVFAPLMHIKVSMSKQHKLAIIKLKEKIANLKHLGLELQANKIDESLMSTIASARTRNMGRIAFRVRDRMMTPRKYDNQEFVRGKMIELTMEWISFMDRKISQYQTTANEIKEGNAVSGMIKVESHQRSTFPRPPQLRRFYPKPAKKPKYILNSYGKTPFGQHAIKRSNSTVINSFGPVERKEIQKYIAKKRYRKFTEHVEYGGGIVLSWARFIGGVIVAIDTEVAFEGQLREHVKRGSFGTDALAFLRESAGENPDYPVLAMHSYDGMRAIWHCIHNGTSYTVVTSIDIDLHQVGTLVLHTLENGQQVLLAIQGFESDPQWVDTLPTSQEVIDYQRRAVDCEMPGICQSLEDDNILGGCAEGMSCCTVIQYEGKETLVYMKPNITNLPRNNPGLARQIRHLRAKVVASLSAGGYWDTSMRGVAFRAYLKGSYYDETIWTGGVIGWRQSSTQVPVYFSPIGKVEGVRAILIAGGFDRPDQLSPYNVDMFSEGYKVVCESRTETYTQAFEVGADYKQHIIDANGGRRYHHELHGPEFLSFLNSLEDQTLSYYPDVDINEAVNAIIHKLQGGDEDQTFW